MPGVTFDAQAVAAVAQIVAAMVLAYYAYETYRLRKLADKQVASLQSQLELARRDSRLRLKPSISIALRTRAKLEELISSGGSTEDEKASAIQTLEKKKVRGRVQIENLSDRIALSLGFVWFDATQRQYCLTDKILSSLSSEEETTTDFVEKFVLREEAQSQLCIQYKLLNHDVVERLLEPPENDQSFILMLFCDIDSNVYAQKRRFSTKNKRTSYSTETVRYLGQSDDKG